MLIKIKFDVIYIPKKEIHQQFLRKCHFTIFGLFLYLKNLQSF